MAQATELPLMSITKRLKQMGMQSPDDLISSILDDTEQSRHNHHPGIALVMGQSQRGTGRPSGTRRTISAPTEMTSNTETEAEMMSVVNHRLMRARAGSEAAPSPLTLKQSHWKPAAYASKCAESECRKRFAMLDRRRNCCKCGEVFCRRCTNYRRKLSANAVPDSFGTFQHVCKKCFNQYSLFGGSRDLIGEFSSIRRGKQNVTVTDNSSQPLCARKSSENNKREEIQTELDRLLKGFQLNTGFLRGLMSEVKVPLWQRSSMWVDSKDARDCFHCKKSFGKVARKLHCRIGGHVFCRNCTQDEILLYVSDDGKARWAVNGKDGGPTTTPARYEMFPICPNCSNELQIMMLERLTVPTPKMDDFFDDLHTLHTGLSKVQDRIEECLPEYQGLVDTLDVIDNSPQMVKGRNPLQNLIKAQSDLSDAFSALAVGSQRLKSLKPKTESQQRLLRHAMIGTYQFYSENMYHFRCTRQRLSELMPIDHLDEIQLVLSQQSMERIHVLIHQLMYEALNHEKRYNFDNSFFQHIVLVLEKIEGEFKPFLEERGEEWDMHMDILMQFVQEQLKTNRNLIKLRRDIASRPSSVRAEVIRQCVSKLHECLRELQAKTIDREFKGTKESLYRACSELDVTFVKSIT